MKKEKFTPKQWVLVRGIWDEEWCLARFSHMRNHEYIMVGGTPWDICIPYEGNEHLLGTTDEYNEPYEPEDGDFVAIKVKESLQTGLDLWICILKSISISIDAYAGLGLDGGLKNKGNKVSFNKDWMENIRPATEKEKQLLLDKLHEVGKDWDADNKKIVDWKWQPENGKAYYCPSLSLTTNEFFAGIDIWANTKEDICRGKMEWIFKGEKECQALCDKLNEAIKNVK